MGWVSEKWKRESKEEVEVVWRGGLVNVFGSCCSLFGEYVVRFCLVCGQCLISVG